MVFCGASGCLIALARWWSSASPAPNCRWARSKSSPLSRLINDPWQNCVYFLGLGKVIGAPATSKQTRMPLNSLVIWYTAWSNLPFMPASLEAKNQKRVQVARCSVATLTKGSYKPYIASLSVEEPSMRLIWGYSTGKYLPETVRSSPRSTVVPHA